MRNVVSEVYFYRDLVVFKLAHIRSLVLHSMTRSMIDRVVHGRILIAKVVQNACIASIVLDFSIHCSIHCID